MSELNTYWLTRWRRLLILRECRLVDFGEASHRVSFCPLCDQATPTYRLEAHHIRPKATHPQLAYDLSNGICLCVLCHRHITHAGNTFRDIASGHHWRFLVPAFDRYVELAANRRYNQANQARVYSARA